MLIVKVNQEAMKTNTPNLSPLAQYLLRPPSMPVHLREKKLIDFYESMMVTTKKPTRYTATNTKTSDGRDVWAHSHNTDQYGGVIT